MFPKPFGDDVYDDCVENFEFFIQNFKPSLSENSPVKYEILDEDVISEIDSQYLWTEIQLDTTCIVNGFISAKNDERVNGYYVCEVPCIEEALSVTLFTEVQVSCQKCNGTGEIKGRECDKCEGQGFSYRYLNEIWPTL